MDGSTGLARRIEPLPGLFYPDLACFIDPPAGVEVVLPGGARDGTDEFHRARSAIAERLLRDHGFTVVAVEAEMPHAAHIDAHARSQAPLSPAGVPFP